MVVVEPILPFHDEVNFKVQTDQFMGYLETKMTRKN
jgi:hypothetical protein